VNISDLSPDELRRWLRNGRLSFHLPPFRLSVRSTIPQVIGNVHRLYGDYPLLEAGDATDFQVALLPSGGIRRWVRPQVNFSFDARFPFKPLPQQQAFALFEWGVNWCIATTAHHYLIFHAAVVAKDDWAILFPGEPGAGKSTLCAALANRGWRLLSDEMALLDPQTLEVAPVPRPVSLKNESIDVIRRFAPRAVFGDVANDTVKGTVSHMKPPTTSVQRASVPARVKAVVFPRFERDAELEHRGKEKSQTLMGLATNSFNYHVHGYEGFRVLKRLVDEVATGELVYSRLEEAVSFMDTLV